MSGRSSRPSASDNDLAAAADYLGVARGPVEADVTYYGEFAEEIDEEIAINRAEAGRAFSAWKAGQQAIVQ